MQGVISARATQSIQHVYKKNETRTTETSRSLRLGLCRAAHPETTLSGLLFSLETFLLRLRQQPLFQSSLGLASLGACGDTGLVCAVLVIGTKHEVKIPEGSGVVLFQDSKWLALSANRCHIEVKPSGAIQAPHAEYRRK